MQGATVVAGETQAATPERRKEGSNPTPAATANNGTTSEEEEATDVQYKGFGSFHSDNVQDLIALPESQYHAPQLPDFAVSLVDSSTPPFAFGKSIRSEHFLMDPNWTFVNHGAFGGALKRAIKIKHSYEEMMESQPLSFVDRKLLPLLVYSARQLAAFLHAAPTDISLVPNATFGLNAAIFGLIESHDVVAYLDTEYGSVWRMLLEKCNRVKANLNEIPLSRYLHDKDILGSDEGITKYIQSHLPAGCTTIVLDHIASNGAFELPIFTHIIPMLRKSGVKNIIIDGAHGPLQCHLDFKSLPKESRPSVYIGNLHKWVSCPKSAGFIWAHEKHVKATIRSPVVSHGFGSGFLSEFVWNGTTDYGAHLTIPSILKFWTDVAGVEKTREYCSGLLNDALAMLHEAWQVKPVARHAPFMSLVQLPAYLNSGDFSAKYIQDYLHHAFQTEVPVKNIEGKLYLRLSAMVYNTMEDYTNLRNAINKIVVDHQEKTAKASRKRPRSDDEGSEPASEHGQRKQSAGCGQEHLNHGCGVGGLGPSTRNAVNFEESSDDEEDN